MTERSVEPECEPVEAEAVRESAAVAALSAKPLAGDAEPHEEEEGRERKTSQPSPRVMGDEAEDEHVPDAMAEQPDGWCAPYMRAPLRPPADTTPFFSALLWPCIGTRPR
jgi:hypothetical protein